jgi:anti-sigma factor RsiW
VEHDAVHELTAAYALDALDDVEAAEYETHLAHCESCRSELAALQGTAASLAYALEGPAPAPELRERILVQARRERSNVVPLAPRRHFRLAAVAAAVAACAALGIGIWAASLSSQLDDERDARLAAQALAVLGDPAASHVSLDGAEGALVVTPSGAAALVVRNLKPLPEGSYYTAWVSRDGAQMTYAGSFRAGDASPVIPLTEPVPDGGLVAVTIEDRPDADEPSSDPVFTSGRT